ncbi:hypothetical protein M8J76_017200 [Diaphorina citri]|nr:hypothetical protein M8J76_017200 [Diaphorina citri]
MKPFTGLPGANSSGYIMMSLKASWLCLAFVVCFLSKFSEQVKSGALIACSRSDPKLDECLMKKSPAFFAGFDKANGRFKGAGIRDPLKVGTVVSKNGDNSIGLSFTLNDNLLIGQSKDAVKSLNNLTPEPDPKSTPPPKLPNTRSRVDLKKRELNATVFNPKFVFLSNYEVSGKIFIMPITGKGKSNITNVNTTLDVNIKWDFVKRNGVKHMKIRSYAYKIKPSRTYIRLDNLFNGDKYLGEEMNRFLNENYKELQAAFLPVFEQVLADEDKNEMNDIFATVSYDELFLD